jgi:hypothetical protein
MTNTCFSDTEYLKQLVVSRFPSFVLISLFNLRCLDIFIMHQRRSKKCVGTKHPKKGCYKTKFKIKAGALEKDARELASRS